MVDAGAGSAILCTPTQPWAYAAELRLRTPTRAATDYLLKVEILVTKGVVGVGLLNPAEDDFLFRKRLGANTQIQTLRIPILNFNHIGRLVVQNWDSHGESCAEIQYLSLFAEDI
jgi:hypothetical protein